MNIHNLARSASFYSPCRPNGPLFGHLGPLSYNPESLIGQSCTSTAAHEARCASKILVVRTGHVELEIM